MGKVFGSRAAGWLVRATAKLAFATVLFAAGCGGDDENPLFPAVDSGTDAKGAEDHAADTSMEGAGRNDGSMTADAPAESSEAAPGADGTADVAPGETGDVAQIDGDGAGPGTDADGAGPIDAKSDGDATADVKLDAPAEAATPVCTDNVKNGSETDIDCGGACAPSQKCGDGKGCLVAGDCTSGVCSASHVCLAPVCTDSVMNGSETDTDCGGTCAPAKKCADGKGCLVQGDCTSGVCSGSHVCSAPACNDGVKNGSETDTDCGGTCTAKCSNGKSCGGNGDCQSDICKANVCIAASCTNGVKDTDETGVDCGGTECGPCDDGIACALNRDCKSGKCTNLICAAPSCNDGVKNGTETDTDCGGTCSAKCDLGKLCSNDVDCVSGHCPSGRCVECVVPTTCPGADNECESRTCINNVCGNPKVAANTPTATQAPGDCHITRCDGNGGTNDAVDDTDTPADDGNQCTGEICTSGVPSHPVKTGTACSQSGGSVCSSAGDGTCVECNAPSTCPGVDNECESRTCAGHVCGFSYTAVGVLANVQTAGDCHTRKCAGAAGTNGIADIVDDTDKPVDGNECTNDTCTNGTASNPPVTVGTPCSQGGAFCNTNGMCALQCVLASDCPGTDNECRTRTCVSGLCDFSFSSPGTPIAAQVAGDCQRIVCNGMGGTQSVVDDNDVLNDNNQCTSDSCDNGTPVNTPLTGDPCNAGGTICNAGTCVACNVPANCGADTECRTWTCSNHACGFNDTADGTATSSQMAGDCHKNVCNGSGSIENRVDDTDVPVDGKICTSDVCTSGVPSNPPLVAGTLMGPQTPNDCLKNVCDGSGNLVSANDDTDVPADDGNTCTSESCSSGMQQHTALADGTTCAGVQGGRCKTTACTPTFMVVRVGDGAAALSNSAQAVFLERHYLDTAGGLVSPNGTVSMPTTASGNTRPLTLSGTASSEGSLSLSQNGQYVTLAGYGAAPGTASIKGTSTTTANRVVGRVDGSNNIDTTTAFTTTASLTADNIRGATTVDGTRFWVAGAGSGTTGGVWEIDLGATTGTQIFSTPKNPRVVHIFSSQLYGTADKQPFANVFTIGMGTPTASASATTLPNMPTTAEASAPSLFSFVLLDRTSVPGLDTLYVADDNPTTGTGGIQKWSFDGSNWTLVTTFTDGLTSCASGARGLAGTVINNVVVLVASVCDSGVTDASNQLVMYKDDGVNTPVQIPLATSPSHTVYRGVALAP
jgi:hypothetical protein